MHYLGLWTITRTIPELYICFILCIVLDDIAVQTNVAHGLKKKRKKVHICLLHDYDGAK